MQKCMSDYLDSVCEVIRKGSLREAARSELADHMRERWNSLISDGMDEESAARETVAKMGEPTELGKKIVYANRSSHGIVTFCVGICLFVAMINLLALQGGRIEWFIDGPSFIAVAGISAAYSLISSRGKLTFLGFVRGIKNSALLSGAIGMLIGLLIIFRSMANNPDAFGVALAITLIMPLYGFILFMLSRAMESRLSSPKSDIIKELLE